MSKLFPKTWWEKVCFVRREFCACFCLALVLLAICGCTSPDCGSKTIVGNHYALPKVSNDTSNTDIEVYESTEGAVVYTRRDSKVEIEYQNSYTNHVLWIWDKVGVMVLKVIIEPLDCSGELSAETPVSE